MNIRKLFSTVLIVCFVAVGCSGDSNPTAPTGPAQDPPPSFSMASVKVQCNDGSDCIQFFSRPDKDVLVVRVEILPPVGNKIIFNAGSVTVVRGENVGLQDQNLAYFRVSGEWKFTFVGNLATGDKTSFEVVATINVGA